MKYFTFSLSLLFLFSFVSCSQSEKDQEPKVTVPISENQWVRAEIGDSQLGFQVLGTQSLLDAIKSQQVRAVGNTRLRKKSLTVAFPKKLLNEHFIFGGVITQVSDSKSALLGGLKLSDLPPISVRPKLTAQETDFKMELKGCLQNCDELSPQTSVVDFPIVGIDEANDRVILDLAVLGDQLNLVKMLDPNGEYTQLKTKTSEVVAVDYSASTLVFDVRVLMVPLNPKEGEIVSETQFTVRWYLRLNSVFNPSFVARDKTEGVGFFTNYSLGNSQGEIKYFLKNIPQEHQESFKAAFDAWNEKFSEVAGRPLIRYEFIDALDPRSKNLVAGDVRYNILEWDLENEASYGGLGPSIANQFTGEILSSNVLIQGPRIVEIYQNWFKD
jgi:hypothetical protein